MDNTRVPADTPPTGAPAGAPTAAPQPPSLWRSHDYRAWFVGDTSSKFSGALRSFALPLAVVALTGSATQAGVIATASQAIGILCMVPGGVISDRMDRRKILYTFAALGMAIWSAIAILFASGALTFPLLITLTSLGAVNAGLFGQVTDAILRTLVHGEDLVKASAANQGRDASIELGAPPVGAALYALGAWVPFAVSVAGYLLLGLCGSLIRRDLRPRRATEPTPTEPTPTATCADDVTGPNVVVRSWTIFADDVRDGLAYLRARPTILQLLAPLAVANIGFMGAQHAITYALVLDGRTPGEIAAYNTAIAVFALVGSVLAGKYANRLRTGWVFTVAIPASTLVLVPAVFSRELAVVVPCMGLYLLAAITTAGHHSIIFSTTPDEMQGRLWAVFGLITSLPMAAGPTLAGVLLDRGEYRLAMALFIAVMIVPALAWSAMPRVRALPRPGDWANVEL
ncbi:MFS transporter [Trueperella abortisuis]|uniref:MFS family permease n=1 Tax=Trueperella abortisuis TaxID=445930 RepID=A0ABT9PL81_9ACTO|nr:MFS transporter [Trueperella abortisuis]MDP9833473.1 MFS family permease [Trueperella abortisuis]